ncbi:hypothetical protein J2W32_000359 [Variovorax boronicumulans]|uniref:Uncharacterized protein n=1 Tax=Variovorax boronicumulans TaxID=436515 RepID=A0AAW8CLV8_9BURK|nr:hypothetical protein [Variovorax boronicumulans]MDP9891262.1 hypothetical protein [Variovorax boronicumulans]MDQ0051330.1 hypothetical protein [Variovorax boronicumulans]
MIGHQQTGVIQGVVITAVSHEGLRVSVDGKPARLAIVLDDGTVVIAGDEVAREAEAVAVNCYRNMLQGKGFLRVLSLPLEHSDAKAIKQQSSLRKNR